MRPCTILAAAAATIGATSAQNSSALPIVDLDYEVQQATSYNSTGEYYTFSNIRYAAPPTGNNRFRAPQPPQLNRTRTQTGTPDRICPNAYPTWLATAVPFLGEYLTGTTEFNASSFNTTSSSSSPLPAQDPRTTEDCLFLDVVVPQEIFDGRNDGYGAPVLVWIYGGGYTGGSKSGSGNPAGLIAQSQDTKMEGVIYVAMNYRLGAFGWLSGPTFQADGDANVGLLDQRFALEWVQQHIAKFGGDPNRVTVFGESAGGGSIMHQITAYGGSRGPVPFQQAVLQSPGWAPTVSNQVQEQTFQSFLGLLNVSTIAQARKLPFEQLLRANLLQIRSSLYGTFTYGPTVDGGFVPALPGELLLHGQFDNSLRVMVGHNADEGLLFTSPLIQNDSAFEFEVGTLLPTVRAWPSVLDYITNTLYPPIFDGSQAQGYKNQIARAAALASEVIFTCNTHYLDTAFNNKTYAYYFTVPPAIHGQDIPYTYYNGATSSVANPALALALQDYITQFAMTGSPNEKGVPFFGMYGSNATVQDLGIDGISRVMDPTANRRCEWWQKVLYV